MYKKTNQRKTDNISCVLVVLILYDCLSRIIPDDTIIETTADHEQYTGIGFFLNIFAFYTFIFILLYTRSCSEISMSIVVMCMFFGAPKPPVN